MQPLFERAMPGAMPSPQGKGGKTGKGGARTAPRKAPLRRQPLAANVAAELSPYQPSASRPFDKLLAAHLMRRAGFGATPQELDTIVQIGVHRAIDVLLLPSTQGLQEFGSVMLPTGEILNLHNTLSHQRGQWCYEAANTLHPLREKMALFWHDHFSVGANGGVTTPMMLPHINIFRRHGLGRFRDVLVEVSRDPAMLYWLDNRINGSRGKINENYGREVLELYTMGEGNGYTQQDVIEASRCFAGWSLSYYNQFLYRTSFARAGAGRKTVLGTQIYNPNNQEQEGYQLIDLLLSRSETAEYLVSKLWSYFVALRPETGAVEQKLWDEIVKELAKRWQNSGYDLRMLMSTMLRSNYFFSPRSVRRLVKNPMEYAVGALRNLGTPVIGRYYLVGTRIETLGLPLLRYTTPAGLQDGKGWIDSQALINRSNYANELTRVSKTSSFRNQWDPLQEVARMNLTTSKEIVDHHLAILVDGQVPAAVRQNLYDFMDYKDGATGPVRQTYDQLAATDVRRVNKIRGLVQLIMALPEYSIN